MENQQLLQIRAPYLSTTHQPHHPTSIYQHFTASYPVISGKKKSYLHGPGTHSRIYYYSHRVD